MDDNVNLTDDIVNPIDKRLIAQAEEMILTMEVADLAGLLHYIETLQDQLQMNTGEPACTSSVFMRGPGGAEILMAIRSPSEKKAWERLNGFVLERIKEGYRPVIKYPDRSDSPAPQQAQSSPAPAPTAPSSTATKTSAPAVTPAPTVGGEVNTMNIVRMEVTPRADNRADLALYMQGHKWPDLKVNNWPVPKLIELLSPTGEWSEEHLAVSQSYTVNFIAEWANSTKLKQSGEPYKNVTAIRPA